MSTTLTFELALKSDYHVGSGHRKGAEVDSALLRESDGRPALRGSLLSQLLRDAARELLATPILQGKKYATCKSSGGPDEPEYCRQWNLDEPECPLCRVFGSPREPRRWEFSSAWLREMQSGQTADLQSKTDDWGAEAVTRVRVSPRMRRTEADKLFSEEIGDGRLVFKFEARWNGTSDPEDAEIALLAAAARNMRHLGKSRRRGRGECRVQLCAIDGKPLEHDWLDKFKDEFIDKTWQPSPRPKNVVAPVETELLAPTGKSVRIRVVARLLEPVLVARRAMAGNQFEGITILPGNILLGALAFRAAAHSDLNQAENYRNFVGLFRRGWAHFLFLAPAKSDGTFLFPAFAASLDVFRCKKHPPDHPQIQHPDRAFALLNQAAIRCELCAAQYGEDDAAVESLDGPLTLHDNQYDVLNTNKREEMHIRIDPESQRVEEGKLFEYVALEAGQFLCGEIICKNAEVWQTLHKMAALPANDEAVDLRFGKATRRGYGRISAVFQTGEANSPDVLAALDQRLPEPNQPFTLLLASDSIIIDQWGRFPTRFEDDWLSEALNMKVKIVRGFAKSKEVDGFRNHLGLPRWRDHALMAGSAVGLHVIDETLSNDEILRKLRNAELSGIGLRCNEGFGQVVINHPIYAALTKPSPQLSLEITLPKKLPAMKPINGNSIAKDLEFREAWENEMGKLAKASNNPEWRNFEYVEFGSVARLLRSGRGLPIDKLINELKDLGKPSLERKLGYKIKLEGNRIAVPREEKGFFNKQEGQEGVKFLITALETLANKPQYEKFRSLGIDMLELKIAEAVERKLKQEQKS